MPSRFEEQKKILEERNYFKLVCGAGNKDAGWVEKLTFVFAMAGATGIDIAADPLVLEKAIEGLKKADNYLHDQKKMQLAVRPFLTVSTGMPGDHHVRKAIIKDNCVACNLCIPVCPTDAIPENLVIVEDLCIGCGACEAVCHFQSINYTNVSHQLETYLPPLVAMGADNIELHAAVADHETFLNEWKSVCKSLPDNYCSLSLDRNYLSNNSLLKRIEMAREIAGERMMVQADGVPMGGTGGGLSKTIQAIACAQQINMMIHHNKLRKRQDRELMVLLSGGTNAHTRDLALAANVEFHGISIGTFARKQVDEFISQPDFFEKESLIENAIAFAKKLVDASTSENKNVIPI